MLKKITTKTIVISCAAFAVLALLSAFLFTQLHYYSLGDNKVVTYLGKEAVGSWLPLSSMEQTDMYYYGTDLNPVELANYFKATTEDDGSGYDGFASYSFLMKSGKNVHINFYSDKNNTYSSPPNWVKSTNKRYFFSILEESYVPLRDSVQ